ncbi:MAG: hypothetical protein EOO68_30395, partial [Moraxellaceae bacterium]
MQSASETVLKDTIQKRVAYLDNRFDVNKSLVPYGHGRLDAFGQIFNAVSVEALNIPENRHAPDAPTSFPFLWDAAHLNVVQWNASAPNKEPGPLFQNATTAIAVYGKVDVSNDKLTYPSSTNILNLGFIQKQIYQLTSPRWPEDIAGLLDKNLVEQGKSTYAKNCIECHSLVDTLNSTRKINAVLVPVVEVGTDGRMATNFINTRVATGVLEGKKIGIFFGKELGKRESAIDVVMHVTGGTLAHRPIDSLRSVATQYADNNSDDNPANSLVYKARPIAGVWASAPYLHNGSVPTLHDLLLTAAERPKQFYVGNRVLDSVKVGNSIEQKSS